MSPSTEAGFGRRLRMERERRTITLASISDNTKISQSLLEALERDDVSRWPSGIFRRSFIRAYAQAVGLDPDPIAREFAERFPDPADAPAPTGDSPAAGAPAQAPALARSILKTFQGGAKCQRGTGVRLTIATPASAFMSGRILEEVKRRWAAAACDMGVVIAIAMLLFVVVNEFWRPFGVTALGYYVGSIVVLGNTPGVSLFAPASGEESGTTTRLESLIALVKNLRRT